MRYKVPQFIEVEDKVVGPFTIKQFVYIAGGGAVCYVMYKALPFLVAAPLILLVGGFALALTFYRINGKPFIYIVQAYFGYISGGKLYVWQKKENKPGLDSKSIAANSAASAIPRLSNSRLKELSWSLDVMDNSKR